MPSIKPYIVKNFSKGLITRLEEESLPKGAASDSKNWISLGDHIELRRGIGRLGAQVAGAGPVTGLNVGRRFDDTEVMHVSYGRKVLWYNPDTMAFNEVGTNLLTEDADGEDIAFSNYHSLAGAMIYLSSPHTNFHKIPMANPTSALECKPDNTLATEPHRGKIKIKKASAFLWDRTNRLGQSDKTGLYRSVGDKVNLSDYDHTQKEDKGNGDGSTKNFAGTLSKEAEATAMSIQIAAPIATGVDITNILNSGGINTIATSGAHGLVAGDSFTVDSVSGMTEINDLFGTVIRVVSSTEITIDIDVSGFTAYSSGGKLYKAERFTDDRNGAMESDLGGTGTINYATGAFNITFNTAPISGGDILADYFAEDSYDGGLADFSFASTRIAGDGISLRQDDAGDMQNLGTIGGSEYCFHTRKVYKVDIDVTDLVITNLVYRDRVGIPYWRALAESGDGLYYMDAIDESDPAVRILEPSYSSEKDLPRSISENLILSDYRFNKAVVYEDGEYLYVSCRHKNSDENDTIFLYNKIFKLWDKLEATVAVLNKYDGFVIFGDSTSRNVYRLFEGISDEDSEIVNHWTSGKTNLDVEGVKEANVFVIAGLIDVDNIQELEISYSVDDEAFVTCDQTIRSDGDYVNEADAFYIGANGIGSESLGGGGGGIRVAPYRREFRINLPRCEYVKIRFEAKEVGYVSVTEYQFKDIRYKGQTLPTKYLVR